MRQPQTEMPDGRFTEDRPDDAPDVAARDEIESLQLTRLAGAVLSKSPDDLEVLAEANPQLVREWVEAFRRQKAAADLNSRYWAAAVAALATTSIRPLTTAAE